MIAQLIALDNQPGRQTINEPLVIYHFHVDGSFVALIFRHIGPAGFEASNDGAAHIEGARIRRRILLLIRRGHDIQAIDHHDIA